MKLGLALGNFSWPVPVSELGTTISNLARQGDDAGFDSLWVMDHFFQIRLTGLPPESPMPEAYATLAFLVLQPQFARAASVTWDDASHPLGRGTTSGPLTSAFPPSHRKVRL